MATREEMIALMRKYSPKIKTSFEFHIKGDIPSKKIDHALKAFASGLDRTTIIGFYDTTVANTGKSGYILPTQKYTITKP